MELDSRATALLAWLQEMYPEADIRLSSASADASFRRYFRVHGLPGGSRVAMDAPPEQEDLRPFLEVAQRLEAAAVRVPGILAEYETAGFLLLDDLGTETYLQAFSHRDPAPLMDAAVAALVQMQSAADANGLPEYDEALLRRELALFPDWYLARECGVTPSAELGSALNALFDALCGRAQAQAQVFVHRDFMPRNLMASDPLPGVIDFQDAVRGPITYDPVCLFQDAFYSFSPAQVRAGLTAYHRQALAAGLPLAADLDKFLSDCRWMAVHRHLKVIGIFARICHRDGKPQYLSDVPRFFAYLTGSAEAERQAGDSRLAELLAPVFNFRPGRAGDSAPGPNASSVEGNA